MAPMCRVAELGSRLLGRLLRRAQRDDVRRVTTGLPDGDVVGRAGEDDVFCLVPNRQLLGRGIEERGPVQGVTHGDTAGVPEELVVAHEGRIRRVDD